MRWLWLLLLLATPVEACWTANVVSVERVIDGDTFVVDLAIWPGLVITERVRLLDVDTPEHTPDDVAWDRARLFTEAWLADSGYTEVTGCKRDAFGRLLARVRSRLKGDLGSSLLMQELAVPYTPKARPRRGEE